MSDRECGHGKYELEWSEHLNNQVRNDMVMEYMPLVHKVVHKLNINTKEHEHEDLVNIGVIGLMKAIEKYDDSLNVTFINYAYMRIKGSIIDELRKTSRVPRRKRTAVNNYYKAFNALQQSLHRDPTEKEICNHMGLSDSDLKSIYETIHHLSDVSLNDILFENGSSESSVMDVMADTSAVMAEDKLLKKEQLQYMEKAIKTLTEREQEVLQLIYFEELRVKEVGYACDISAPRVSQIHGNALLKLREAMRKDYAHD